PGLPDEQYAQLAQLEPLYREWYAKINVISRKDMDAFYLHHVLHSLTQASYHDFAGVGTGEDEGTGGGFPGIPLAIVFPHIAFTLLDATGKKIGVVREVASAIGLTNVTAVHARVEEHRGNYDLIVSRAVSSMTQLVAWTGHLMIRKRWLLLKGGDPKELRKELPPWYEVRFTPVLNY